MGTAIARNLEEVRSRIASAARRAGREPGSITLVGVSKTMPIETIREAFEAGLGEFGENRVQEAREKRPQLPDGIRWHLVGHLQGNKAAHAARLFQVVHSVDSVEILERLEQAAAREGRWIEALAQVDLAGEATKSGVRESNLDAVLETAAGCRQVALRGLMILPPYDPDPEKSRPWFRRLRGLLEESRRRHPGLDLGQLSMGMSEDFEVAIEEGATLVRVGRALFGERRQA
ncbi:MAG TPA: YggS family pyridoxal phosphate-dependent enzyme [Candidatus Polarisedimenticolia bacterium]|nr:YggS family pyridoxal phosphate-dependent enzyme [Candidatus Polarisedimenticolia bacterium]